MPRNATIVIVTLAFLNAGCAIHPNVLAEPELRSRMSQDLTSITASNEPLSGPIDLYQAMARALNYNLDFRLEMMKSALEVREHELSRFDMLPQLVTNIGWNKRNNYQAASSISYQTGIQSLEPSYSQEKKIFSTDLGLSWNVLDFGLSYVRAKQQADNVLISNEQKRKVLHRVVQDVRSAYWRAVSAERLLTKAEDLEGRVAQALDESQEARSRRLTAPLTALTYERELIGIKRELQQIQRDLAFAKVQLAALINVRPGDGFELEVPAGAPAIREIAYDLPGMEETALLNRPEILQMAYEERINANDAKAALIDILPGIELNFGVNYNDNDLLVNNDWVNYGAQMSHSLIKAFSLPWTLGKLEAQEEVLYAQRLALTMAVLTQVHVSRALYEHSKGEYQTSVAYMDAQNRILEQVHASSQANRTSKQTLIREQMNTLVAEARHDLAYADLETAYAGAYVAMGLDPLPDLVDGQDIQGLAAAIQERWEQPTADMAAVNAGPPELVTPAEQVSEAPAAAAADGDL